MTNSPLDSIGQENTKSTSPAPNPAKFTRYNGNPIITPTPGLDWQVKGTYNPAALHEDGKVHLIYRAQANDGTSVLGYAASKDGFTIDENLNSPIYQPRESFEIKTASEGNSGCEDPRITKIGERLYMTYTAYDSANPPRIAFTSIALNDFLQKKWNWDTPKLISPPGIDDKDSCIIVERKMGQGYTAFHRLGDGIWVDHLNDLEFSKKQYLSGSIIAKPRQDKWDNVKIGIAAPPLETEHGWVLLYHAVSDPGFKYKIGAMLLDYNDPRKILGRTDVPLLEPEQPYELEGKVPNVVFACGAVVIDGLIYLYYGGADTVVGVATMPLDSLTNLLLGK